MTLSTGYIGSMAAGLINRTVVAGQEAAYLEELKDALGIERTVTDYDNDLTRKLKTAIGSVEQYCSVAMQPQQVTVNYGAYTPGEPLPYGPVWTDNPVPVLTPRCEGSTITISDSTGTGLSEGEFPYIERRFPAGKVVYTGGYSRVEGDPYPVPEALIGAVLEHAAACFRSGGISGGDPGTYWKTLAGPFRRF